jgi:hypothetical protein
MEENTLKFENIDNFNIILIKPENIDHLDWNDDNYTLNISELSCYEIIDTNKDTFLEIISEKLNVEKFKNKKNLEITTQIISEIPDYIYEIIYITDLNETDDIINNVASLLNTNDNKIYGNAILLKTFIPSLSNSILINNITINDIKYILDGRVKTNIVIYDGEWSDKIVIGKIEDFANSFFDENYTKLEIPFLLHNINIWYELCDGCSTMICGNILEKPVYKCIWFTMITNEYRGSIYLNEVEKIIDISKKIEYPFTPKTEWINDEIDDYSRKIIKNKYKVLNLAYSHLY